MKIILIIKEKTKIIKGIIMSNTKSKNEKKVVKSLAEFKKEYLPNTYNQELEKKNNNKSFGSNLAISIINEVEKKLRNMKTK